MEQLLRLALIIHQYHLVAAENRESFSRTELFFQVLFQQLNLMRRHRTEIHRIMAYLRNTQMASFIKMNKIRLNMLPHKGVFGDVQIIFWENAMVYVYLCLLYLPFFDISPLWIFSLYAMRYYFMWSNLLIIVGQTDKLMISEG